jgi:D-alanyl-D-alanine carboxypeptidase
MIGKIKSMGYYKITSMYRSVSHQQEIWDTRYQRYRASGYSHEGALAEVAKQVAIPGTSEHHLGLAVDISAGDKIHDWLAQNSWEYGFILRYPEGKTDVTGIIHEPWHFRYLGRELAEEVFKTGLTLEEYMDMLTQQAGNGTGTASNPELFG